MSSQEFTGSPKESNVTRREFHQLGMAALGGFVVGSGLACQKSADQPKTDTDLSKKQGGDEKPDELSQEERYALLMSEPHVCRGLNMCKGHGAGGKNDCAGLGQCASVAEHSCAGENECKGQGGCGEFPGQNACKGQGGCAIPLMDHAWTQARKDFEAAMKTAGKEVGPAPAKADVKKDAET